MDSINPVPADTKAPESTTDIECTPAPSRDDESNENLAKNQEQAESPAHQSDRVIDEQSRLDRDDTAIMIPIGGNHFAYRYFEESPIKYLTALETVRRYDGRLKTYIEMTDPNTHIIPLGGLLIFLVVTIPLTKGTLEHAGGIWLALCAVHLFSTYLQMRKLRGKECFNKKTVAQNLHLYKTACRKAKNMNIKW